MRSSSIARLRSRSAGACERALPQACIATELDGLPHQVVELVGAELEPDAIIVDVGAGSGLFSSCFAHAMPRSTIFALEVRTDALQLLHEKVRNEALTGRLVPMRMSETAVPALPGGTKADLIFVCDVLDFVAPAAKESFLLSLRALLGPQGRYSLHQLDRSLWMKP